LPKIGLCAGRWHRPTALRTGQHPTPPRRRRTAAPTDNSARRSLGSDSGAAATTTNNSALLPTRCVVAAARKRASRRAGPAASAARRPTPPRFLGPIARGRSTSRRRRSAPCPSGSKQRSLARRMLSHTYWELRSTIALRALIQSARKSAS
jgi:hypothetical protein